MYLHVIQRSWHGCLCGGGGRQVGRCWQSGEASWLGRHRSQTQRGRYNEVQWAWLLTAESRRVSTLSSTTQASSDDLGTTSLMGQQRKSWRGTVEKPANSPRRDCQKPAQKALAVCAHPSLVDPPLVLGAASPSSTCPVPPWPLPASSCRHLFDQAPLPAFPPHQFCHEAIAHAGPAYHT